MLTRLRDQLRARGFEVIGRLPDPIGSRLLRLNEALGRPLADAAELADRQAFAQGQAPGATQEVAAAVAPASAPVAAPAASAQPVPDATASVSAVAGAASARVEPEPRAAAPVIVYHLEKHRRDIGRLTQPLDAHDIPYRVMNLEEDVATQTAVRRDGGGRKMPLVFIAGKCVGGREELAALDARGELLPLVFGS